MFLPRRMLNAKYEKKVPAILALYDFVLRVALIAMQLAHISPSILQSAENTSLLALFFKCLLQ